MIKLKDILLESDWDGTTDASKARRIALAEFGKEYSILLWKEKSETDKNTTFYVFGKSRDSSEDNKWVAKKASHITGYYVGPVWLVKNPTWKITTPPPARVPKTPEELALAKEKQRQSASAWQKIAKEKRASEKIESEKKFKKWVGENPDWPIRLKNIVDGTSEDSQHILDSAYLHDRDLDIVYKRLQGIPFKKIGYKYLSTSRVSQIFKKSVIRLVKTMMRWDRY